MIVDFYACVIVLQLSPNYFVPIMFYPPVRFLSLCQGTFYPEKNLWLTYLALRQGVLMLLFFTFPAVKSKNQVSGSFSRSFEILTFHHKVF